MAEQLQANPSKAQEYYDYTDVSISYDYYAYGNAVATEVQPGVQSGAGGFVSTASDLARFYTSMFVTKNASAIISDEALALMTECVSVTQSDPVLGCECFGLGLFMIYNPPCNVADVKSREMIYYQGAINCATATVMVLDNWEGDTNSPYVSVAVRNNVVVDATEESWMAAKKKNSGNLTSIMTENNWFKYGDSWMPAWNNALYFQSTAEPYASCSSVICEDDDENDGDRSDDTYHISRGEIAACVIVPCIVTILTVVRVLETKTSFQPNNYFIP